MAAKPHPDRTTHPPGVASSAAVRLNEALAVLTRRGRAGDRREPVTIAALCRLAAVSRNSLYRYHTGVLDALRRHQAQRRQAIKAKADGTVQHLRNENASLREQIGKLAALVDHYYAAYRETHALLQRQEREAADLRRALNSKLHVLGR